MIPFSELLRSARVEGEDLILEVSPDWLQGRSAFGGLQAAFALRSMRALVSGPPLRTVQATFVAPAGAATLRARARVLRTGKSVTHVEARLEEGDTTLAVVIGVFGWPRASTVRVAPPAQAAVAGRGAPFVYREGVTPAFTRHFAARWLRGLPPYTGDTAVDHVVALDLNDTGPTTEEHLLAIADFVPPVALSHLHAPAAGSTLTWMLELLVDRVDDLPLSGWRIDATLVAARDGYTSQSVMVWGPDGRAVAVSRQNMMVFG